MTLKGRPWVDSNPLRVASPEKRIWRYMSLEKFVSLLDTSALHFARSDRLGDPFEGSVSAPTIDQRREMLQTVSEFQRGSEGDGAAMDAANFAAQLEGMSRNVEVSRRWIAVSCWNLSEVESAALWSLYAPANGGIAVCSTVERLIRSFRSQPFDPVAGQDLNLDPGEHVVRVAKVRYLDYAREVVWDSNGMDALLHKRISYAHEQELRALLLLFDTAGSTRHEDGEAPISSYVDVDLETLIERVLVSPAVADWFRDVVGAICERFGLSVRPGPSSLDGVPLY